MIHSVAPDRVGAYGLVQPDADTTVLPCPLLVHVFSSFAITAAASDLRSFKDGNCRRRDYADRQHEHGQHELLPFVGNFRHYNQ